MSILLSANEARNATINTLTQELATLEAKVAVEIDKCIKARAFNCTVSNISSFSDEARSRLLDKLRKLGYSAELDYDQREGYWVTIDWSK
ncbi:hypothetical protein A4M93_004625 [Salmonella enterica subsp. enterica]|uniref:Uncharacterized protein n=1 Tax=Salmonella phage vB_StyS-LmqsSP1 TaxID=2749424 RepID=A0AAE7TQL0_9CAUD|nr:hypothetical protein [Salmonella enterica subsp. enterica]EEN8192335.1 hypothetical protein [Salmonella enterica subsp. enterica serovar Typhimurium]QQM13592.1 hypothetical protein vBStySLmqsSP_1061 [Salmonella phage vB_StyS-LmqsSP1]